MKTLLLTVSLAVAGAGTAQAQMFRPSATSGAVLGAVAGGLIGGHNGDRWAEGMVIGAVAGGIIGAAVAPREPVYAPPVYRAPATTIYSSATHVVAGQPTTVVHAPAIYDAPTVPNAPVIVQQPAPQVVYAPAPAPQVVYVEPTPRVVYVPAPPPVVYVDRSPRISLGFGYHHGPRYHAPVYRHYHPRHHHHVPRGWCRD